MVTAETETGPAGPYAQGLDLYLARGWTSVIPLGKPGQRACKAPVPTGATGHEAAVPSERVLAAWRTRYAVNNLGLHLADALGVLGIDVDHYTTPGGKTKTGGDTLAALEAELGPLPPTFVSTARGPGKSGVRVFRVPPGFEYVSKLADIEIIQAKHRYLCAWPSIHPDTGERYEWYDLAGRKMRKPPAVEDLAWLPKPWVEYLIRAAAAGLDKSVELDDTQVRAWLDAREPAQMCRAMRAVSGAEIARLSDAESGSRYDTARDGAMALVRLGAEGHRGCNAGLVRLRAAYGEAVAAEPNRDPGEWRRLVVGAVAAVSGTEVETHGRQCPDRVPAAVANGAADMWPSPGHPLAVAERVVDEFWTLDGARTLAYWQKDFYRWTGTFWAVLDSDDLRARLYRALAEAEYIGASDAVLSWAPNRTKVANVTEALTTVVYREADLEPDVGSNEPGDVGGVALIPFANGMLHLVRDTGERTLKPHSPGLFNLYALPFDYAEDAGPPKAWLRFLDSLEIDADVVDLLQEWFGYVISGDLSMSRMLYLYGATRAGKGVITRVLQALVGRANHVSPNLSQFGDTFGLEATVGKTLVTVNDARFRGIKSAELVERLLNFTGGDHMSINRKNRQPWTGPPVSRVMIVSNDLPSISGEQSSAFAKRILGPIHLRKSFYAQEDFQLERRLAGELVEILMWAFDGYDRLCENGGFTEPVSSAAIHFEMSAAMQPVELFLSERCVLGSGRRVTKDRLYAAYRNWANDAGLFVASKIEFGRQLLGCDAGRAISPTKMQTGHGHADRVQTWAWRGVMLADRVERL